MFGLYMYVLCVCDAKFVICCLLGPEFSDCGCGTNVEGFIAMRLKIPESSFGVS